MYTHHIYSNNKDFLMGIEYGVGVSSPYRPESSISTTSMLETDLDVADYPFRLTIEEQTDNGESISVFKDGIPVCQFTYDSAYVATNDNTQVSLKDLEIENFPSLLEDFILNKLDNEKDQMLHALFIHSGWEVIKNIHAKRIILSLNEVYLAIGLEDDEEFLEEDENGNTLNISLEIDDNDRDEIHSEIWDHNTTSMSEIFSRLLKKVFVENYIEEIEDKITARFDAIDRLHKNIG